MAKLEGNRKCVICEAAYSPKRGWQRFCGYKCKQISWAIGQISTSLLARVLKERRAGLSVFLIIAFMLGAVSAEAHPIDLNAICQIESNCNDNAIGKAGEIGRYQITPICLKHFKQVNGDKTYLDRYDDNTSWDLKNTRHNEFIANWYLNWLYDRCWTVKDTIVAWNWGIGNWRKWQSNGSQFKQLPKTTQAYLKKYEQLTKEKLS